MSTAGSIEPLITGDKGTNGTHNQVLESEAGSVGPSGEAADVATRDLERHGDPGSSLPINGAYVSPEGLRDESQYSPGLNTSSPAPESQEARDDPGFGGKQVPGPPSRVNEPFTASNEDQSRTSQDRTHRWQTQQLTGWAAVEKTLTDFDQQEVSGYKEDIDSLLTFAGLYSGVLTAFVIVSFTQLQEDTAAESLKVLRIIANQTSNAAETMLTAPLPFQPSLTAKRVNVLWFASLIISLSTASLAILVKQWLRAYMAFASSSPQGQLRIRHFRRSGLETWRVFGIASMLPLLLQISLALFFVGLCFFTADIDPVIGFTTLPLVCAWAFLFITVTLAPAFSARCPYKTPALSSVTTTIRTRVWFLLRLTLGFVIPYPFHFLPVKLSLWLRGSAGYLPWHLSINKYRRRLRRRARKEEADVLNDASKDLAILASADAIQANFELDLAIVEDVLKQTRPGPYEALEFLVQIIANRVPFPDGFTVLEKLPLPLGLINCESLSTRTKAGIITFLDRYVINADSVSEPEELGTDSFQRNRDSWDSLGPVKQWAISIFASLSESGGKVPDALHPSFTIWFRRFALSKGDPRRPWEVHDKFPSETFTMLCLWLDLDYTSMELPDYLNAIQSIISHMGRHIRFYQYKPNRPQGSHALTALYSNAAHKLGSDMQSYYWEHYTEAVDFGVYGYELSGTILTLCKIVEHWGVNLYKDTLTQFVERAFLRGSDTAVMYILATVLCLVPRHVTNHPLQTSSDCRLLVNIIERQESSEARTRIINALCLMTKKWASPYLSLRGGNMRFVDFTSTALQFLRSASQVPLLSPNRYLWRRLFLVITRLMEAGLNESLPLWPSHPSTLISFGEEVDAILRSVNELEGEFHDITEQRRNSPIPDIFCLRLGTFIEEEGKPPIWTAKHLRDISPEERATIIAEGRDEIEAAIQAVQELREPVQQEAQSESESTSTTEDATVSDTAVCLGTVRHWWQQHRPRIMTSNRDAGPDFTN
ncbi:hypothetical protein BC629DRAFT_428264 [Irpex lacteus]|nr:hypothetical protein BC629DRAFT_428264 [Irpex lacteus]